MENSPVLSLFHPLISRWFQEKFLQPTEIQTKAWPIISGNGHVLITAPTGSGKTLTAFLWAINKLLTGHWPENEVHVLYISPLRALNADIQRNLLTPLQELRAVFQEAGEDFPGIRVVTRSGDTPQSERRRMLTHPPEILITTPESLNLMLSSPRARGLFFSLKTVILDEIHSIAQDKRGTHMITAVDRLVRLSGEFQRIALSATVKPLSVISDFVAGFIAEPEADGISYSKRQVTVLTSDRKKPVFLQVAFPPNAREAIVDKSWWPALVKSFKEHISKNRSTLIFTNTRKLSEKITGFINEEEPELIAYAHHGSLSKEVRFLVEEKLKKGELKAIVATSSLELGIDIGNLDEVILVEAPPTVSSGLQRIGRAGHGVDEDIRGIIFPTHGKDFLLSAVMARCIMEKDIEDVHPVICPLDVLAQIIISMTCMEQWDKDDLYDFLRTSYPFHNLSRKQYDITINMLTGKYSESRIRELNSRIMYDRIDNTLTGKKGSLSLLYLSGGTIPDRGYFDLKVRGSETRIGSLDEEFVWERRVGNIFCLGTQAWKIVDIDHQNVEVIPWPSKTNAIPFWKADKQYADSHFMQKVGLFCERWNDDLDNPDLLKICETEYYMQPPAAEELILFLKRQRETTKCDLPHRHHILIEHSKEGSENSDVKRVIIHTLWGGKLNYPYSLAISAAWQERYHYPLEYFANDFCIMILLPQDFDTETFKDLVDPESIEHLLRKNLESTGMFGALFRQNAGRALLLPRMDFNKRLPLWLTRKRSKKLLSAVFRYPDFPIILETWRQCFSEVFEMDRLKQYVREIRNNEIRISEAQTLVSSPFAADLIWRQVDKNMYEDDTPFSTSVSGVTDDILKEVIAHPHLRPRIKKEVIADFVKKVQRTAPGYGPNTMEELIQWIKERILLPENEWNELLSAFITTNLLEDESGPVMEKISAKVLRIALPRSCISTIVAIENLPRLLSGLSLSLREIMILPLEESTLKGSKGVPDTPDELIPGLMNEYTYKNNREEVFNDLFAEWCRFYGPLTFHFIETVFGIPRQTIETKSLHLSERGDIIVDEITEELSVTEVCDTDNFERLLRLSRKKARPAFEILPVSHLPLFLATWQGIISPGQGTESFKKIVEQLFGYPAPSRLWETDLFASRVKDYSPSILDTLLSQSNLMWFGCKKNYLTFALKDDLDLFLESHKNDRHNSIEDIFPDINGRYTFWEILDHCKMDSSELTQNLWKGVWQGTLSNESFEIIRKGIQSKFRPESFKNDLLSGRQRLKRIGYNRWKTSRPIEGSWYHLCPDSQADPLFYEELKKERVRQLFLRYGILFRELLISELPPLRWKEVFKTLYLMELSGEITSGYFFEGIRGPQFISREAYNILSRGLDTNHIFHLNTLDPAYPYDALKINDPSLPYQHESTHIVFHGIKPVLISRKRGKEIDIRVEPDNPDIPRYLELFHTLVNRKVDPLKIIKIEKINGLMVLMSPYCDIFIASGFYKDYNRLILRGGY
ncbi:MAG: DEAD/DEAH box helicase [Spirochaetales bacterium]|nr:DEAD/DEAH box helicase [Spirochaetales bacterium]